MCQLSPLANRPILRLRKGALEARTTESHFTRKSMPREALCLIAEGKPKSSTLY